MASQDAPTPPESEMEMDKTVQTDLAKPPADDQNKEKQSLVDVKHPRNLNNTPPEVLVNIVKHIYRPSDLKSLCLTSKSLYNAAVKELYRTVSLEVGKRSDLRLSAFLKSSNAGLKSIRVLRVHFEARNNDLSESDNSRAHAIVRMLIDHLPENILEDFEWSPWLPFNQETYLLLLQKQQRLKWITAFRLDEFDIIEKLKSKEVEHANLFKSCQKLAIYPDTLATLELGHYFLTKIPNLKELILHTNFTRGPATHFSHRQLNDGPTGPGLVTSTLFGDLVRIDGDKCKPFANLTAIRLVEVGLRHCTDTFGKVIDFTKIETLRLAKCSGADALLSLLCKSSHLPRKLRYLEFQHDDNSDNDGLTALDDFLCLVEGIEELFIDMTNVKALPSIDGIIKHGKTLELLLVHASDTPQQEEHVWPADDFQRLCSSATKLEQLSCAWPVTSVLRANSPSWDSFHFASRQLQHLITLHISTFPCTSLKANLEKSIYTELLRGLAGQLLTDTPITITLSKHLKIIAFGVSDKIPTRQDSAHQLIFLRSTLINADLKEEDTAVPISWANRQWTEPRSDVLDFELSRRPKIPVRDYASFMDDDTEDEMV